MTDEPQIEIPFTLFLQLGRYLTQRPWAEVNEVIQRLHAAELLHQAKIADHTRSQEALAAAAEEAYRRQRALADTSEQGPGNAEAVPA